MKVELKVNGKTVQVEMSEKQLKELGVTEERSRTVAIVFIMVCHS